MAPPSTPPEIISLDPIIVEASLKKLTRQFPPEKNAKGCKITTKAPKERYVKAKIHGSSDRKEWYLHHLALIAVGRSSELEANKHVSHLCGESRCYNPEHLCVETPTENANRKSCSAVKTFIKCPCCEHKFNPCQHGPPRCILFTN